MYQFTTGSNPARSRDSFDLADGTVCEKVQNLSVISDGLLVELL